MRAGAAAQRVEDVVVVTAGFRAVDLQHITLVETEEAGVYAGRTSAPSVLDRLAELYPTEITPELRDIGIELAEIARGSGLHPTAGVSDYQPRSASGSGAEMSDAQNGAATRLAQAMNSIRLPLVRAVVQNVVICDVPDSRIGLLKVGLIAVARHWGRDSD